MIIADGLTKEEACDLEVELIAKYDTLNPERGYNLDPGGEHSKHTEETIEKIRQRAIEQGNHRTGLRGKAAGAGFLMQIDPETNEVVATHWGFREMERVTGFNRETIRRASITGRVNHGYIWKYERNKDVITRLDFPAERSEEIGTGDARSHDDLQDADGL